MSEEPCRCHNSHAAVVPFHPGHCCFFPSDQTCHPQEVAAWRAGSPREDPASGTTPAGDAERGSVEQGGQSGAFPAVRLIPAGSFPYWPGDVVAIRRADNPRLPWHCSNGARLADEQMAGTRRLVPVGPLLELVAQMQGRSVQLDAAEKLGDLLASLLGETATGEGS